MRAFLVIIIALFLSSCMDVKEICQNPILLNPEDLNSSSIESGQLSFFKRGDWPSSSWWSVFNSPTLNQLIEQAISRNPTIQSVYDRVEASKQEVIMKKSPLFPSVFFDGTQTWGRVSENGLIHALNPSLGTIYDLVDLQVNFNYQFDFWGKNRNELQAQIGEYRAEMAESKQVELIITTEMANAFFALKTNLARLALYEELRALYEQVTTLQETLFDYAIDNEFLTLNAVESTVEIDKEIETLQDQIKQNQHMINALRAERSNEMIFNLGPLDEVPQVLELPETLSSDLLARRPDLMAQIWRVQSMAYNVNVAIADFFPSIDLKGFFGLESLGFKHLINWASRGLTLTPSIHLPIFKVGEIRARVKRSQALLNSTIETYNEILLKSLREVADAVSFVEKVYMHKRMQQVILDQAQAKVDLYTLRSQVGLDNEILEIKSKIDLTYRQIEEVMVIYSQYQAVINMIRALGGGYQAEDLARLNCGGSNGS